MRLGNDALSEWRLFSHVLPVFVHALEVARVNNQIMHRHFPIINGQLEWIALTLFQNIHLQHDVTQDSFQSLYDVFEALLCAFEAIVCNDILIDHKSPTHNLIEAKYMRPDLWSEVEPPQLEIRSEARYPKLDTLSNLIRSRQKGVNSISGGAKDIFLTRYVRFGNSNDHLIEFKRILNEFIEVVEQVFAKVLNERQEADPGQSVTIGDQELANVSQVEEYSKAATVLFTLLVNGIQSCPKTANLHSVKVHLGAFDRLRWDLLLSSCNADDYWHPTTCTRKRRANSSFSTAASKGICSRVQQSRRSRQSLDLLFDDCELWNGARCENYGISFQSISRLRDISLEQLMKEDLQKAFPAKSWTKIGPGQRRKIATLLACSMLYLYNSPWLGEINAASLFFLHDNNEVNAGSIKGPYLKRSLSYDLDAQLCHTDPIRGFSIVTQFGIFLSELESGCKFERHDDDHDFESHEFSLFLMLQRIRTDPAVEDGVEFEYLSIIDACLNFDELVEALYHPQLNEQTRCRAAILKHILKPLMQELKRTYPKFAAELSDIPQYLISTPQPTKGSIDSRGSNINVVRQSQFAQHTTTRNLSSNLDSAPTSRRPFSPSPLRQSETLGVEDATRTVPLILFEDDLIVHEQGNEKIIRNSETFLELYKEFLERHMKMPKNTQKLVRIAVLDTGVDEEDDVFHIQRENVRKRRREAGFSICDPIQENYNFIGGGDVDSNGHGTHIATLLMTYAPYSNLYIAKIAHGSSVENVEHVSLAVDWAIKHGVDIITMSFGINEEHVARATCNQIKVAIATASGKGILLFAAASNRAGNGSRTYPASSSHVICAHAVDGVGHDDGGLNPPVGIYTDRFATLGVAIRFSWFQNQTYKSGTSYATPFLAATAANVLAYATYAVDQGALDHWVLDELHGKDGMVKMFLRFMSSKIQEHNYIAPWFLWTRRSTDSSICSRLQTEL